MRRHRQARWAGRVAALAATVVLGGGLGGLAGPGAASAAACAPWSGAQPVDPPNAQGNDTFAGVALVSSCEAWAVGGTTVSGRGALIWHWTGGGNWTESTTGQSLVPGDSSSLSGVAATDQSHVWAVGSYTDGTGTSHGLLARFDGGRWATVATPPSVNLSILNAVTAVSATDVWAVGHDHQRLLVILHFDGTSWSQVPAPAVPSADIAFPTAVTATSASDAWVVGFLSNPTGATPLTLHWNGTAWSQVAAPDDPAPGGANTTRLNSVSATSPSNAWAVGVSNVTDATLHPVTMHWDGQSWKIVANPGAVPNSLNGVTAVSANSAWAVGGPPGSASGHSLVLHWNGTAWAQVSSNAVAPYDDFTAISPGPAGMVFAVGLSQFSSSSNPFHGLASVFGIVPIGALKDTPQQAADLMASAGLSSVVAAVGNNNPACNGLTIDLIVGTDPAATVPTAPPVILDQCDI